MSTRSQKKSNKAANTTVVHNKRVENSWILLAKESLLENSNFNIITLPHPAHGKPAKYCLDVRHKKIFEVVTFNEPHRSWFIGETVKSDGSIQMMTPVNPVFLVLPRLKAQCSSRAIPLEDLLSEKGFDKVFDFIDHLDNVADSKGSADLKAYKYNEDKTLSWLEERVRKLAKVLRAKNIHVTSGAVSATFITSNAGNGAIDEEFYLKYAFGVISEYLEDQLVKQLEEKFKFKPDLVESVGNKRKSEVDSNEKNKKIKCDASLDENKNGLMDISKLKTPEKKLKPLTVKEKARQKAASGSKTISSFFTKKQ
ncbi:Ribonuclease H2 subunit B [Operophtera brumata]|uniref:Ribonuclease H2 subunit B n=1 Tax=Operophtera brumata TaxID=104452 RepID=A0A0L7L9V6_OPEBR|nr:Ribonuclease H2 subunit B [Operophtera brumata]